METATAAIISEYSSRIKKEIVHFSIKLPWGRSVKYVMREIKITKWTVGQFSGNFIFQNKIIFASKINFVY